MTCVAVALCSSALFVATAAAQTTAGDLPEGEGRDAVVTMCGGCHGLAVSIAHRHSRAEWRSLINMMHHLGAPGGADEAKVVMAYFLRNLGLINVNTGSQADLQTVLDIPEETAAAIVAYRMQHGQFHSLEELAQVPGLDADAVQLRKDRIEFKGP